jgi:hypothetical protein
MMRVPLRSLLFAATMAAAQPAFAADAAMPVGAGAAQFVPAPVDPQMIEGCVIAAANLYRLPPLLIVILLNVEGGRPGQTHANDNGTVDIGPMQINQLWVPNVAAHWHATMTDTYVALDDSFCANVEAGSWILRQAIDEANGQLWLGVAYYHSHTLAYQGVYLQRVLAVAREMETLAVEGSNER